MAVAPLSTAEAEMMVKKEYLSEESDDEGESGVEDGSEFDELEEKPDRRLAVACDDGCVRMYYVSDSEKLTYYRSLPRVSGEKTSFLPFTIILILYCCVCLEIYGTLSL